MASSITQSGHMPHLQQLENKIAIYSDKVGQYSDYCMQKMH